ncbi:hydroxymethylglutaryl-CoA lyase [Oceanobacillus damuensis]|uniref:hydroxymethylglutaryl-CoA lyase n=1 Tax=Oceanobacillus damuensis TaxID=937928 RepID=UPI000ABE8C4C|nr:hydroxymethylglutaryl-CoA lyase [Oceanobacillus damuensis]
MKLPTSVVINECWARDGLQNQHKFIETNQKIEMLELLVQTGFRRIEATSFSHPKYVPQFRDALDVLKRLPAAENVQFKTTCVNRKALERAIEAKNSGIRIDEISFVMAAHEDYNLVNVRMNNKELLETIRGNIELAQKEDFPSILVSVSTAFGYQNFGDVSETQIVDLVTYFYNCGIRKMAISDTTGMGNPKQAYDLFALLLEKFPNAQFIAHFHDTKGWGIANNLAALQAGVRFFDSSLGGIGGPPAERLAEGDENTGNVCTEDFVLMLETMGIDTGLDLSLVKEAGRKSEELLGRQYSYTLTN